MTMDLQKKKSQPGYFLVAYQSEAPPIHSMKFKKRKEPEYFISM